jgi:cysteine-rich repeat protein
MIAVAPHHRVRRSARGRAVGLLAALAAALPAAPAAYAGPDLSPLIFNVKVVVANVDPGDVVEGCAGGQFNRRLVSFSLRSQNLGPDDLVLGNPGCPDCVANPGAPCANPLFVCSIAHGHAHFESFVRPELLDAQGTVVAQGHKFGFCLLDTFCTAPKYTCANQGISAGCSDLYSAGLPCQYVDITDENLPPGPYTLRITIDPFDQIAEDDETNNVATAPVQLDPPPPDCPDGDLDPGEACDDGNANAGDGCDPTCAVEPCFVCKGTPSRCTPDRNCVACQRTVSREAARFAAARAALLARCEIGRVKGQHGDPCPDPGGPEGSVGRRTADKIARAEAKLRDAVARRCGGDDGVCGGDPSGEVTPAELNFPAPCPGFAGSTALACTAPLNDCADLADCLICIAGTASGQGVARTFGDLLPDGPERCQRTIGAATQKLVALEVAALERCWDARVRGLHADVCPDPLAPRGTEPRKAAERIERARAKHARAICRACGGSDRACGGGDDADPLAEIGFRAACDDVHVDGGEACGAPITTLGDLVDCTQCVSTLEAQCLASAPVPSFVEYPHDCADF